MRRSTKGFANAGRDMRLSALPAVVAVVVAAALAPFCLSGYFVGDDYGYVWRFLHFPFHHWPQLFIHEWSGGIWGFHLPELRPIAALTFLIDSRLWEGNALGYKLTNLALFAGVGSLTGWLAFIYCGRQITTAVAATLLFMLHPVHAEPIAWITGRVDTLATFFYLAMLVAHAMFRRTGRLRWLVFSGLSFILAVFSKEFALTAPIIALFLDPRAKSNKASEVRAKSFAPYAVWTVVILIYGASRSYAFGRTSAPQFDKLHEIVTRQLSYLGSLLSPLDLWRERFPDIVAFACAGIWIALVPMACFAAIGRPATRHRRVLLLFGPFWYLNATLPLIVAHYFSDRHLLLASVGFCIMIAAAMARMRSRRLATTVFVLLVAIWGFLLASRLAMWSQSGQQARRVLDAVVGAEHLTTEGSPLVLDVPAWTEGNWSQYVWAWASPYALRPPFTSESLDLHHPILTAPAVYFHPEAWAQQTDLFNQLSKTAEPGQLIYIGPEGTPRSVQISPSVLNPAAARLAEDSQNMSPEIAWRLFVQRLHSQT